MKDFSRCLISLLFLCILNACGPDSSSDNDSKPGNNDELENNQKGNVTFSGIIGLGLVSSGTEVLIKRLDETNGNTIEDFHFNTTGRLGVFFGEIPSKSLYSAESKIITTNIIDNSISHPITLKGLYYLDDNSEQTLNVNLFTHLTYQRSLSLIKHEEISPKVAIEQAESELIRELENVSGLSTGDKFANQSIFNSPQSEGNDALLLLNALMYQAEIDKVFSTTASNFSVSTPHIPLIISLLEQDFKVDGLINMNAYVLETLLSRMPEINPVEIMSRLATVSNSLEGYTPANIETFLDSDLDGLTNIEDSDADNDGIDNVNDKAPLNPSFILYTNHLHGMEDTDLNFTLQSNNPTGGNISSKIAREPKNGSVFGNYPNLTYRPTANSDKEDRFSLILIQDEIESEEFEIVVTMEAVFDAPLIDGNPETLIQANNYYEFVPTVTHIEDTPLEFQVKNLPLWASFDKESGTISGYPNNKDAGVHPEILISVSSGGIKNGLQEFDITVAYDASEELSLPPIDVSSPQLSYYANKLYLSGGSISNNEYSQTLQVYDIASDSWEIFSNMDRGKVDHTSHFIDGKLYTIGGNGQNSQILEIYDPVQDEWKFGPYTNYGRDKHTSCAYKGNIYVFGRNTIKVEMYDVKKDQWINKADMAIDYDMQNCFVKDGLIYLIAADNFWGFSGGGFILTYDPNTDSWEPSRKLHCPSYRISLSTFLYRLTVDAIFIKEDEVYLIGRGADSTYKDIDVLNLSDFSCKAYADISGTSYLGSEVVGEEVYFVGNGQFYRYSPLKDDGLIVE